MNTHKGMTMKTRAGNVAHVLADPNMSKETESAIEKMIDLAYDMIVENKDCELHRYSDPDEMGYVECSKCGDIFNIHDEIEEEDEHDFDAELEYEEGNIDEGELIWRTCGIG